MHFVRKVLKAFHLKRKRLLYEQVLKQKFIRCYESDSNVTDNEVSETVSTNITLFQNRRLITFVHLSSFTSHIFHVLKFSWNKFFLKTNHLQFEIINKIFYLLSITLFRYI